MRVLASDAPRLGLITDAHDTLTRPTRERLAAILRARGWATNDEASLACRIIRWRPQTTDPALALLLLAADHPETFEPSELTAVEVEALLGADVDTRLTAAVALEAGWLAERRAVPLFTAERWVSVSSGVRGVRVRADGVPLLHDAYLAGER
jgi:hypothetical protein